MEQTDLRTHRTAACLAFADHMNRFIAGEAKHPPLRDHRVLRASPLSLP
jgi:hypothetical protein